MPRGPWQAARTGRAANCRLGDQGGAQGHSRLPGCAGRSWLRTPAGAGAAARAPAPTRAARRGAHPRRTGRRHRGGTRCTGPACSGMPHSPLSGCCGTSCARGPPRRRARCCWAPAPRHRRCAACKGGEHVARTSAGGATPILTGRTTLRHSNGTAGLADRAAVPYRVLRRMCMHACIPLSAHLSSPLLLTCCCIGLLLASAMFEMPVAVREASRSCSSSSCDCDARAAATRWCCCGPGWCACCGAGGVGCCCCCCAACCCCCCCGCCDGCGCCTAVDGCTWLAADAGAAPAAVGPAFSPAAAAAALAAAPTPPSAGCLLLLGSAALGLASSKIMSAPCTLKRGAASGPGAAASADASTAAAASKFCPAKLWARRLLDRPSWLRCCAGEACPGEGGPSPGVSNTEPVWRSPPCWAATDAPGVTASLACPASAVGLCISGACCGLQRAGGLLSVGKPAAG